MSTVLSLLTVVVVLCTATHYRTVLAQNQATCDGIDAMISRSPLLQCARNSACDTATCVAPALSGYTLILTLLSCRDPPGVRVIVTSGGLTLYNQVVDHSVDNIAVGSAILDITLDQLEEQEALGIQISARTLLGPVDLVPYSVLPLDTQSCSPSTDETPTPSTDNVTTVPPSTVPSSSDPPSTDSPSTVSPTEDSTEDSGPYGPTCDGFDRLINNVNHMECTRNKQCDTANCNITNPSFSDYTLSLTLLSCRVPRPGVLLIVRDGAGEEVVNTTIDESRSGIDLGQNVALDVTLDQLEGAIGIEATLRLSFFSETLLSYTVIPLDRRSCPTEGTESDGTAITTTTTDGTTESTTLDRPTTTTDVVITPSSVPVRVPNTQGLTPTPRVTPTPTPTVENTTCAVLAKLAMDTNAENFKCVSDTTAPCDTVSCAGSLGKNYSAVIVLMPCVTPAAVRVVMSEEEKVLVDKTVDHSQEISVPELPGLVLDVTFDHFEDAIGLQVDAKVSTHALSIIKYTVIPLERAKCVKVPETDSGAVDNSENSGVMETTPISLSLLLSLVASLTPYISCAGAVY